MYGVSAVGLEGLMIMRATGVSRSPETSIAYKGFLTKSQKYLFSLGPFWCQSWVVSCGWRQQEQGLSLPPEGKGLQKWSIESVHDLVWCENAII